MREDCLRRRNSGYGPDDCQKVGRQREPGSRVVVDGALIPVGGPHLRGYFGRREGLEQIRLSGVVNCELPEDEPV